MIYLKNLGFGLMRLPVTDKNDSKTIDIPKLTEMVDAFMAGGFTYFDTAYIYHGGMSEVAIGKSLVSRYPRDSFTLTTKLPTFSLKSKEEMQQIFDEQLRRTGAGYFDYYLIHAVSRKKDETIRNLDCFGFVSKMKAEGKIKHIGFSFHDSAEYLDKLLTEHPETEVVQLQINYLDWDSENIQSRKCAEVAKKHGKKIIVMEPVKGGALAVLPDDAEKVLKSTNKNSSAASYAIRFAASVDNVFMVLSGMSNTEQLNDNMSYMKNFVPVSETETQNMKKVADMLTNPEYISCTSCGYCMEVCSKKIKIPEYFRLYNSLSDKNSKFPETDFTDSGTPEECISCGECHNACPQHLPVSMYIKKIRELRAK